MWLAPFKNTKSTGKSNVADKDGVSSKREPNFVCLLFDRPVAVAALELFNYSKTPERGVHEFEVEIDSSILFRGYARQGERTSVVFHQSTNNVIERLHEWIYFNPGKR